MNKKGLLGGLAALSILAVAAVGFSSINRTNANMPAAHADSTTYKLNTLNWDDKRIEGTATGEAFDGIDGYHIVISECAGTTDWHISLSTFESLALAQGTYNLNVKFDVLSLTGDNQLNFIVNKRGNNVQDAWSNKDYDEGKNQSQDSDIVISEDNVGKEQKIEFNFGKTVGAFEIVLKEITITNKSTLVEAHYCYLVSPTDFKNKWNKANENGAFCSDEESTVKGYLKKYAGLVPWIRENFRNIEQENRYDHTASTLGAEVDYWATKLNVQFE